MNTIVMEGIQIDRAVSEVVFSLASSHRVPERTRCLMRLVLVFFFRLTVGGLKA